MARRIVWTQRANTVFTKLLEYYILRNKSKEYSRKLNKEINSYLVIIAKQPFLGMKTNDEGIYVIVKGNFKIYYQIEIDSLVIILIWDCRQNSETINLKSNL